MPRQGMRVVATLVAVVALLVFFPGPSTPPPIAPAVAQAQGPSKYTGTASCANSKCHGDPNPRAEKCVACHLAIDAEMVAAGHPDPISFELDTFSREIPNHWRDKGTWFSARLWSIGQVVALREAAKRLGERAEANTAPKLLQEA